MAEVGGSERWRGRIGHSVDRRLDRAVAAAL